MATFTCTRCGKCCMSLGRHIRIERNVSGRDLYCRFAITGDLFLARIQPEYKDLFAVTEGMDPHWCTFLRMEPGGAFVCCCYPTRPPFCRSFRCATAILYDRDGAVAGRIKGRRSLDTTDPVLRELWDSTIAAIQPSPDAEWLVRVKRALEPYGYSIEPLE